MTHMENFTKMLREANVPFEIRQDEGLLKLRIIAEDGQTAGPVQGYVMFYTEFCFTKEGQLQHVGIWE